MVCSPVEMGHFADWRFSGNVGHRLGNHKEGGWPGRRGDLEEM